MRSTLKKAVAIIAAGGLGVGLGVAAASQFNIGNPAEAAQTRVEDTGSLSVDEVEPIRVNSRGQSYGSSIYLLPEDWPDLVLAVNENGQEGYLPKEVILPEVASSPEEAVRLMNQQARKSSVTETQVQMLDHEGHPIPGVTKLVENY